LPRADEKVIVLMLVVIEDADEDEGDSEQ